MSRGTVCLCGLTGSNGFPNFGAGLALNGVERKDVCAEIARGLMCDFLGRAVEKLGDFGTVTLAVRVGATGFFTAAFRGWLILSGLTIGIRLENFGDIGWVGGLTCLDTTLLVGAIFFSPTLADDIDVPSLAELVDRFKR